MDAYRGNDGLRTLFRADRGPHAESFRQCCRPHTGTRGQAGCGSDPINDLWQFSRANRPFHLWRAEILENGGLEDGLWSAAEVERMLREQPELLRGSQLGLPLPWEPLISAQGNRYEPRWGDAANSSRSLEIMALPSGESGIRQRIYLPVH
jgi:hypothetical protein